MDCRQVQPRMADFSVGLLRAGEMRGVEDHLTACAACGLQWRELQAVLALVERHGSLEPPPHLWNGVYNRITAEPAAVAPGFWQRLLRGPNRLIAGTATGLAAAALLAGLYFGQTTLPPGENWAHPPRAAAQTANAVQQHAMLAGAEPFADEVGLEAYARLVANPDLNNDRVR